MPDTPDDDDDRELTTDEQIEDWRQAVREELAGLSSAAAEYVDMSRRAVEAVLDLGVTGSVRDIETLLAAPWSIVREVFEQRGLPLD